MKQTRFTEAQIVAILQEADANGVAVKDVCNLHGVCEQTFYRWKSKFGGMEVSEAKRLKQLEEDRSRAEARWRCSPPRTRRCSRRPCCRPGRMVTAAECAAPG